MADENDVRRLALALPGTTEQPHHGFPSFRTTRRIYASLPDGTHAHVMLDPAAIGEAVAAFPEACVEKWWGKQLAAVRIELAAIPLDALAALLEEAHGRP
jgi:hypothetical protein